MKNLAHMIQVRQVKKANLFTLAMTPLEFHLNQAVRNQPAEECMSLSDALRDRKMRQRDLADELDVHETTVSKWKTKGVPESRVEDVAEVLGVDPDDLRPDPSRAGEYVESKEALGDWHKAVSQSDLHPIAKQAVGTMATFLEEGAWVSVFSTEDIVETTGWPEDKLMGRWGEVEGSPFVERIGASGVEWVFRLRFPDEL